MADDDTEDRDDDKDQDDESWMPIEDGEPCTYGRTPYKDPD